MFFNSPLVPATLIKRYKRFLFDAELDSGEKITGSCPNTGSMLGLTNPGSRIWMSLHDSPTRKYKHALELVEADGTTVGINTGLPNKIVEEALSTGAVDPLNGYAEMKREQRYGKNSRIDILLQDPERPPAYVEVKNVHFIRTAGLAEFPDSATKRGAKHLDELGDMVDAGNRAVMVYLVQRADCERLKICRDLDSNYGKAFDRAIARGVEALAMRCQITPQEIRFDRLIPVDEPGL
ncbi:DNA/RNA nuclease SfsA [Hoeflea prorocentri]|uniref:Sugar fermentation stimulation protein homolog n=1 Tax=Hoeflea prorocentri TaxID=1922333 RepID=A0A9X3ZH64_9HYPH|nr:DNA/RNA nuclease SfsA [Hoeflea prorocentri]MCY6380608.1 DNA/RNA nuclease SfsA [Hoeflea prorocentri]MDA5398408.1 DNA/RNA nuclease SfsA [Hoeflea prorocentri]